MTSLELRNTLARIAVATVGAVVCVFVGVLVLARLHAGLPWFYALAVVFIWCAALATAAPQLALARPRDRAAHVNLVPGVAVVGRRLLTMKVVTKALRVVDPLLYSTWRFEADAAEPVKPILRGGDLPLVGQVTAGVPSVAIEDIEDFVAVPHLAGGDTGEFLLRVGGDSMQDAGILAGDYVVIRPQETAQDGEIVVALIGDEATLKRFFRETDHIRLQPENASMDPILSRDARVIGKVVGVLRGIF